MPSIYAAIAVAAALAVTSAQAATAVYYNFNNGAGTEASPVNIRDTSSWTTNTGYNGNGISQEPTGQHDFNFGFDSGRTGDAWVYSSKSGKIANQIKTHTGHFVFKSGDFECADVFYLGETANTNSTVTKKGGAWVLDKDFHVAHKANGIGTFVQDGGTVWTKGSLYVGNPGTGELTVNVGKLTVDGKTYIGRGDGGTGTLTVSGGIVTLRDDLIFNDQSVNSSGSVVLKSGATLYVPRMYRNVDGAATFSFDGGTLVATLTGDNSKLFSKVAGGGPVSVSVSARGGTINNNGSALSPAIAVTITGEGGLTLAGSGVTRVFADQAYTGTTTVSSGTTLAVTNVVFAGPLAFESGATLSVASYSEGTVPVVAAGVSFPESGTVGLVMNGLELATGREYPVIRLSSGAFSASDLDKIALPSGIPADAAHYELRTTSAANDTLVLVSGGVIVDNVMTSLTVSGRTELKGAGGVILPSLDIPADATLVLDPIATPIKVSSTPTFAAGAKIALSSDYAGVTLGRVVLMTYSGAATFTQDLFDSSSVAGAATLSEATAPDGTSKQLVLTVGDYEAQAKEIRILAIGDSITHGYHKPLSSGAGQHAQYRTAIAARLAANGYKPVMLGHLSRPDNVATTHDAAGVRQPDEWIWHSGVSGNSIATARDYGGMRDNLHVFLDVAGEPDVVTILAGTNDIGGRNESSGAETYALYTNLVWEIARQRPRTKIVGSTILERSTTLKVCRNEEVIAFNDLLLGNLGAMPETYACTNLYPLVPQSVAGNYFDGLHPTAKGFAPVAKGFAAKIMEALPLATYLGPIDDKLTDAPQFAQGATNNVPAAYRNGMVHVFTIESTNPKSVMSGSSPYTWTNAEVPLTKRVKKAGYYMELVRKGTSRRRFVWVDFKVRGKTLDDIDFPWTGDNIDLVVDDLHVYSNDGGVHNVAADRKGVKGIVVGTRFNVSANSKGMALPRDVADACRGWDDTLTTSGTYGAFQAYRIFASPDEHWNGAQTLFAWNRWGANDGSKVYDEIGIGDFSNNAGSKSMNYISTGQSAKGCEETVAAGAYQMRHLEIWVETHEPTDTTCDIVIYGSSPAAISAAIEAKRMGKTAVVVSPETRIGGLTTGGLGQTDIGNKGAFGGIALEFYQAVSAWYADPAHWTWQEPDTYSAGGQSAGADAGAMWTFEPSAALAILEGWERRDGLDIRRDEWLDRESGVEKSGGRIVALTTLSGNVYRGKVFIDATYEGDLFAAAGVGYHVGREANGVYGETLNGIQVNNAKFHQLTNGVNPYVVKGDSTSGLLPNVEPYNPDEEDGDGDSRVQAYNFRMCLTDVDANRIPFKKPWNYDELEYQLLFRNFAEGVTKVPWGNSGMPNKKTDTNNSQGFSTDFIGRNYGWPEGSYEERGKILREHLAYQQGLMWTLANSTNVPVSVRNAVSKWGTCKDEFLDGLGDGWQSQLYVREARRMVGDYVMTEWNCKGTVKAGRPVAMAAYTMDSHHVRRYVTADGDVKNEGDVEVSKDSSGNKFPPYPIDYGSIIPKRSECENILVPVCLSASHIAFGSIRMEPVFFALGQAAGAAASLAVEGGDLAVQDVPYESLQARLLADGQVLSMTAFETANGDTLAYTFGNPVLDGEIAQANIGSDENGNPHRFVFRSGTVNVRDGGYVRVAACEEDAKTFGNIVGANSSSATLNIEGGVFWASTNGANLASYSGTGRLRIGVNNSTNAQALAKVNLASGSLKVDNVLMCGGSMYNSDKAAKFPAQVDVSGGTAEIARFWLGAADSGTYSTALFNLTGGEMRVGEFVFQPYHNETFNWGSGTIVATAANIFVEKASAGGCTRSVSVTGAPAVFDTAGFVQTLPTCIAGGTGTLKLAGGGTVTLSGAYTGAISVEVGTTLSLASKIYLAGALSVADKAGLAEGTYTVATITGGGVFTAADLAAVTPPKHGMLRLSDDGTSILCDYATSDWPAAWTDESQVPAEVAARFDSWKAEFAPGVAEFGAAAESAFLLGVAPTDVERTLAASSIVLDGGVVKVTGMPPLNKVNGVVYLRYGATPATADGCKAVEIGEDGVASIRLEGAAPAKFYRICVGYSCP